MKVFKRSLSCAYSGWAPDEGKLGGSIVNFVGKERGFISRHSHIVLYGQSDKTSLRILYIPTILRLFSANIL